LERSCLTTAGDSFCAEISLLDLFQPFAPLFAEQLADDWFRPCGPRLGGKWRQGIRGEHVIEAGGSTARGVARPDPTLSSGLHTLVDS